MFFFCILTLVCVCMCGCVCVCVCVGVGVGVGVRVGVGACLRARVLLVVRPPNARLLLVVCELRAQELGANKSFGGSVLLF